MAISGPSFGLSGVYREFRLPTRGVDASDSAQPKTLRLAAIGALRRLGRSEDRVGVLAQLATGPDPRLNLAAAAAIRRIDAPAEDLNPPVPNAEVK